MGESPVEPTKPQLALIVPASNTVMEPDFHRKAGEQVTVSTWRIFLESVTREAEERMLTEELPRCLEDVEPTRPDLVVFGCTSAGSLEGLEHDAAIGRVIGERVGAVVVTVIGSMIAELGASAAERVAVFTPYAEELTTSVAACVSEAGYEVVRAGGMGMLDNRRIGAVTPERIVEFVRDGMMDVEADAVFLSCTNWRAIEAIDSLTEELGVPVLSSNQVTLASVKRALPV